MARNGADKNPLTSVRRGQNVAHRFRRNERVGEDDRIREIGTALGRINPDIVRKRAGPRENKRVPNLGINGGKLFLAKQGVRDGPVNDVLSGVSQGETLQQRRRHEGDAPGSEEGGLHLHVK